MASQIVFKIKRSQKRFELQKKMRIRGEFEFFFFFFFFAKYLNTKIFDLNMKSDMGWTHVVHCVHVKITCRYTF